MLRRGETIADVKGGPFHSVVLTSRGRVFYCGNLYKRSSLATDDCIEGFIELNTPHMGKITAIEAHPAAVGFRNVDGEVHLLGCFEGVLYDEPFLLPYRGVGHSG